MAVRWRCAECGRTYDEPPDTCTCGSATVEPADDGPDERFSLLAVRRRLLDPDAADRSLVSTDDRVVLAFRALLVVSLFVLLAALVVLLV